MEKQKAKFTYGILEKQFSNLFKEALRRKRCYRRKFITNV